ncbi:peptidase inhibitor family I36 protein [Streptomyces sp. NBC_01571]|uniref:peptidase inhibitor family I36 protein n=1 Tax=Streptomyces sp. NBC_01571 TaxID=2975883 RepID=UPI002255656E|nr:peptidase inhibitor family I36 protein [Streptomyces sp. NBC_01571]MCX4579614.1 peptidase inhibitor family I36 protein [Streptomyces sp. NBC_01571]
MNTKRLALSAAASLLALTGCLALATPAGAADCPSGNFCVWENANFDGQRANWSGDDGWWESWIADTDSSWANHGLSGPGVKDHVKVYENAWQGGAMTICLGPGEEVGYNAVANDRGDSHTWSMGC